MNISDFHSHEDSINNYCWNAYDRENQPSLLKEVENTKRLSTYRV